MKLTVFVVLTLFSCTAFAQDASKTKPSDGTNTATTAGTKADKGATENYELPLQADELKKERIATDNNATTIQKSTVVTQKVNQSSDTKPSPSAQAQVEQEKEVSKKQAKPKK